MIEDGQNGKHKHSCNHQSTINNVTATQNSRPHFFGRITNNSCPYSIGWPLLASFFTISPATSDSISLSSFMASTMHSTCPTSTESPTFAKGGAPGDGAS